MSELIGPILIDLHYYGVSQVRFSPTGMWIFPDGVGRIHFRDLTVYNKRLIIMYFVKAAKEREAL